MSVAERPAGNSTLAGILWMVTAGLFFVGMTGGVRYLGSDLPVLQAAFLRYAFGLLLIFPAIRSVLHHRPTLNALKLYTARGLVHTGAVVLWFYAMARIPIAEVTAIGYTAPIFVTIGAALFLGEKLHLHRIAAVGLGFLGTLIILRPGFETISLGQLAQLCAAPFFATSFLIAKKLTDEENPAVIVIMLSLFCTILLLPGAIWQWRTPTTEELLVLALTATFATAGHYSITKAYSLAPITVTQPISFLQLVWAGLLGLAMFDEALDPYVIAGGAVIISAAAYISHREATMARRIKTPPSDATR